MLMFTKNMFKALYMSDFTFELSCPVEGAFDGCGQAYPYPPRALDYKSTESYPASEEPYSMMSYTTGLWEIPNINLKNKYHSTCGAMVDGCDAWRNASTRQFSTRYWLETAIITWL